MYKLRVVEIDGIKCGISNNDEIFNNPETYIHECVEVSIFKLLEEELNIEFKDLGELVYIFDHVSYTLRGERRVFFAPHIVTSLCHYSTIEVGFGRYEIITPEEFEEELFNG